MNTISTWRGAVEPAESGASGNEIKLWRGAVEPAATAASSSPAANVASVIYASEPVLGVDPYGIKVRATIEFKPGTVVRARHNNALIYVYANEGIVSGTAVSVAQSFTASADPAGGFTSLYAIGSGEYGWVAIGDVSLSS